MRQLRLMVLVSASCVALACGGAGAPASAPEGGGSAPDAAAPAGQAAASAGQPSAPGGQPVSAPGQSAAAVKPAAPVMMPMDVPKGTDLVLTLETPVSSETSKPDQAVRARVAKAVVVSGMTVIPEGAIVRGAVVAAERSGRVKGRASIALRFNEVTVADTPYRIATTRIAREAQATKGEDAKKIGIGAGAGAAIGAIAGGKKGAAIGAGVGGGAGTGVVLATRGEEVTIPAGTTLRTTIQETVRITAPM